MVPIKYLLLALTATLAIISILPSTSQSPSPNLLPQCLARTTITSRAATWVDNHVPYDQNKTYQGYRTDCSGYVSMCWELSKPGLSTSTLHTVSTNITKDALLAGDAIICEGHHVVLFGGWSDSTKTHYVAYEETNPQYGTVKRVAPYPYFTNTTCFHPIRYNGVC